MKEFSFTFQRLIPGEEIILLFAHRLPYGFQIVRRFPPESISNLRKWGFSQSRDLGWCQAWPQTLILSHLNEKISANQYGTERKAPNSFICVVSSPRRWSASGGTSGSGHRSDLPSHLRVQKTEAARAMQKNEEQAGLLGHVGCTSCDCTQVI